MFERVVAAIRDGAPTATAIETQGIDHSTFYRHLQRQPELVPTLQAAQIEPIVCATHRVSKRPNRN